MTASATSPIFRFPPQVDREIFLRDYWQKRPLLMRAGLATELFALTAEELAGLACEPEFESRLITAHEDGSWTLRHGPLGAGDFAALPRSHWTLLVQDVDKFLPQVARLIDVFGFVPGWRIDDIMLSYATDQGGVGPHTDAYDVFLMQAQGRRRWRISAKSYTDADLIPGLEQRILSHFETDREWVLAPGDVLYLPPGVAHWGTAEGNCMTYSLGFRAPSQLELASDWFQHLVSLSEDRRLADPQDLDGLSPAELTAGIFNSAGGLIDCLPNTGSREFRLWLGRYLTEPKPQFQIMPTERPWQLKDLKGWLARGKGLHRHPCARLAWTRLSDEEVVLFYQGDCLLQAGDLATTVKAIAEQRRVDGKTTDQLLAGTPMAGDLLLRLINLGILEPQEDI